MSRSEAITPPAMLGVLGGGQLGWYFALAAHQIGYRTTVLDPDPFAPAGRVADVHLVAAYDDPDALAQMAATCAVVTTEFLEHQRSIGNDLSTPMPAYRFPGLAPTTDLPG